MSPKSWKRNKENLSVNPNKIQIKYIHMKITNMKKYNRLNSIKVKNEKYILETI